MPISSAQSEAAYPSDLREEDAADDDIPADAVGNDDGSQPFEPPEESAEEVVYSPLSALRQPGLLLRSIVRDIASSRQLSWRLFVRNIQGLYRQTVLGLFWAFLPPLAQTAMWVFLAQRRVISSDVGTDVPYPLYVFAGMVLWQGFFEGFMSPLAAVQAGRSMLPKINFPRESLLIVAVGEVLFNLMIRFGLLLVVMLAYGVMPWTAALAPFCCVALVMLGVSLGLMIMPYGSLYQDVGKFITIIGPFWMILTPVVYAPPTTFPAQLINYVNPAAPLLLLTRDMLLSGTSEYLVAGGVCALVSLFLLAIGVVLFRVSMPILIERMNA